MGAAMRTVTATVALLAVVATTAHAKWKPEYANAPQAYKDFYNNAHDSRGRSCCMQADAHSFYGAYKLNRDGSVDVSHNKKTFHIPSEQVLKGINPTGTAVWWYAEGPTWHIDYCFALGTLS